MIRSSINKIDSEEIDSVVSTAFRLLPATLIFLTMQIICLTENTGRSQDKASDTSSTQEVIAEGVGSSADEALKDAFRNAVRQVVGAAVDAETVLKNDEIIDDKVLTYSDGFIKKYDEVPGAKKVAGGLHRIKIKAQVERRSVIAKLKSANITVKKVDGKGMFAELVTQQEGEANADELIRKALSGFPALLTATVMGKPEYNKGKSELVIKVNAQIDQDAYKTEVKKLEDVLTKIAISKDSVTLKATPSMVPNGSGGLQQDSSGVFFELQDSVPLLSPGVNSIDNQWCLWICTSSSGNKMNQKWNGYVLPGDPNKVFVKMLMPHTRNRIPAAKQAFDDPSSINSPLENSGNNQTILKATFVDTEGVTVAEQDLELSSDQSEFSFSFNHNRLPLARSFAFRRMDRITLLDPMFESYKPERHLFLGFIAPFALEPRMRGSEKVVFGCGSHRTVLIKVKVTPDELKKITDVTCNIEYTPPSN
jgi:hypothetical protein